MLQDGDCEGAIRMEDRGDTWREVRAIGLEAALHAAAEEVLLFHDRVGLVAVRHDEVFAHRADRVVDDKRGIFKLRRVVCLGADAVIGRDEDAVPAVCGTSHDPVVDTLVSDHDAAAWIGIAFEQFQKILHGLPLYSAQPKGGRHMRARAPSRSCACPDGRRMYGNAASPW